jgi:D-cysteine desulfhydrase family pyridoxal phosphate-dependent enzyme
MGDRFDLQATGTPLQRADRLGDRLGFAPGRLWVKRDDLTGVAGGGNKARKLEYLVADASSSGADTLVTIGAVQSNHVRATGSAARRAGLDCVAVLLHGGSPPREAEANVVLDEVLGIRVRWAPAGHADQALAAAAEQVRAEGRVPYVIPMGGSSPVGMRGYVDAARELAAEVPDDALVVCASSTGGTQAGLAAGFGHHGSVLGVDVGALADLAERVAPLAEAAAAAAGLPAPAGAPQLRASFAPYAAPTDEALDAIRLAAVTEGLVLDPVYSGRGLAGLLGGVTDGDIDPERTTVFLHTGGMPALFAHRYRHWFHLPPPLGPGPG